MERREKMEREGKRRIEELETKLEKKVKRRRNIVIKGVKVKGRGIKESVKELIKEMGI